MEVRFFECEEEVRVNGELKKQRVLKIEKSFGKEAKSGVGGIATQADKLQYAAEYQAYLSEPKLAGIKAEVAKFEADLKAKAFPQPVAPVKKEKVVKK